MKLYVVGGAVRDMLLGRGESDRDYLVMDASPEEFLRRFPQAKEAGRFFPVFLAGGAEYAWPRGASLEEDLAARDLTVNAMAMPAEPFETDRPHGLDRPGGPGATGGPGAGLGIIAHPQSFSDLSAKILRPASATAMQTDPVRVFRAARFAAELPDFSTHPELIAQMQACAARGLLEDVIPERIARETLAAMKAPQPGRFLEILNMAGCLAPWFAPLDQASRIPAGPAQYHDRDVLGHTVCVMNRLAGDALRVWMGLAHDLGKTATPVEELPAHHGHERRGAGLAVELAARLRLPAAYVKAGKLAAKLHMTAGRYLELRPGTRVDLLHRLNAAGLFEELFALVGADRHDGGHDGEGDAFGQAVLAAARADLDAMLAVRLQAHEQNQGAASGARLRELRCLALAK